MKLRRIQELFIQDRNEGRENDRKYKKKKKSHLEQHSEHRRNKKLRKNEEMNLRIQDLFTPLLNTGGTR